jgi:hypothetical protein
MSEKELAAKNVHAMIDALNNAVGIAAQLGLKVELNSQNATSFGDEVPRLLYSARVYEEKAY